MLRDAEKSTESINDLMIIFIFQQLFQANINKQIKDENLLSRQTGGS